MLHVDSNFIIDM